MGPGALATRLLIKKCTISIFPKKELQFFITNTSNLMNKIRNNSFFVPLFKLFSWNLNRNVPFYLVSENSYIWMTSYGMGEGGVRKVWQYMTFWRRKVKKSRLSFINKKKMVGKCYMMMINCFCGMIDRRKPFSLIPSRDHCQRGVEIKLLKTVNKKKY